MDGDTIMIAAETYSVASNPVYYEGNALHVLFAGESQTKPNHVLGPKIYDYFLLHYVEHGKGTFRTEHHTYHLHEGDCFLIHPDQLVSYSSDPVHPWRYRWVAFTGDEAYELVQSAGFHPSEPVARTGRECRMQAFLSSILRVFYERKESASLASIGYLHLIFAEAKEAIHRTTRLTGAETAVQRTVKQMIHFMSSQYAHPVSIEQMSESLGYNRAYLSRIFKRETGMTPVTYLLKLRIDKARRLLRERSELSIEQIAASVGITDALYFSRQFRRFYDQSPSQYRQSVIQQANNGENPPFHE
ncbi:AraC family transcriptional regulator [Paenibacillus sediminis]|uniref:AraC-like DNA-binding protein n=1 Tax=Paenibacillus sediminis TaxID=664909 RepID=A0ABS4GY54_9BACL|nr:AraC family transcriptional regulator [Paenibacillus sediminis]MBP1935199.1 AraC-like DNA-binding protein [Paenibacillus sediminis]